MAQKNCLQVSGNEDLGEDSATMHQKDSSEAFELHEGLGAALHCKHKQATQVRHLSTEDPCFVAPHPDLLRVLIAKFKELKEQASDELPILRTLLRLIEPTSPLLNNGVLHAPTFTSAPPPRRARLTGAVNVAIVLVDFPDKQFTSSQTTAHFKDLWFGVGNNSVNDFYQDASNKIVQIVGEVAGPFRMPNPITYYANSNYGLGGSAPNSRNLATDAANAAKGSINFAKYDNDGDGTVETFVIVHAGRGAEITGDVNDIWSHKWAMSSSVQDDGVTLFPYLTVPGDCLLGVCAHELGHLAFNWPDLYDTDYSSSGIGDWCLMASGSYNGNQSNPSPPSAWCKVDQQWVTVTSITTTKKVSLPDVKTGHSVVKLRAPGAPSSEYWLLENRHAVGRDAGLPGDGLLVWHIDDTLSNNDNEQTHYKVALVQADGRRDLERNEDRGDNGDQFPGVANVRAIGAGTTPNTKAYSAAATGTFALSAISDPAATVTFTVTF